MPIRATLGFEQKFFGFKLFYDHVADTPGFIRRSQKKGWHILYLERRSAIAQVISNQVAHKTRRFHGYGKREPVIEPFHLDPQRILDSYRTHLSVLQKCRDAVATIPHISLFYEDDLQDSARWQPTAERLFSAFGLDMPDKPIRVNLDKPWSRPYSELVTNYAEVRALLEQEEAAHAINEESKNSPK